MRTKVGPRCIAGTTTGAGQVADADCHVAGAVVELTGILGPALGC